MSRKREDFAHNLEEMSARLSGDVPVVTGIQFTDAGTVLNVNVRNLEQSIGQFTTGLADYPAVRSLKEDADRQNQARQVEAIMVPQVLVGGGSVEGYDGWVRPPNAWWMYKEITQVFSKPFSEPPDVAASLRVCNWVTSSQTDGILMYVLAKDVTTTNFVLRFETAAANPIYWLSASWVVTGKASVASKLHSGYDLASLGNPVGPALIPSEARQAVLTPQWQSAPQLAGGKFSASFNAIPGRTYNVEASSNLRPDDWSFLGSVTASDFLAGFDLADIGSHPQRFFRISTP